MPGGKCEILVVGGGTGGFAAALIATSLGHKVILTEETDLLGGQLTAQIVPPDEHPWIEQFGCTFRYRQYRNMVRQHFAQAYELSEVAKKDLFLNPGSGWVSKLCHEPKIGVEVLNQLLIPAIQRGLIEVLYHRKPFAADVQGDEIRSVRFLNLENGEFEEYSAPIVIDATELGDLLALTGTEYVSGAESKSQTQEPNAIDGPAEPDNVQGLTWCFAMGMDPKNDAPISKPEQYEKWRTWKPDFWPGPLLGFKVLHAHTGVEKELPLFGRNPGDWYALFPYRQVVNPDRFANPQEFKPATIVNWPQNDYFEANIIDVDPLPSGNSIPNGFEIAGAMGPTSAARLHDARQLSLSLLYWLQTEAPRHDDKPGAYPSMVLRPDLTGTADGFAKYPYVREARRMVAQYTVCEQELAAYTNPGADRAPSYEDSVGIGSYRIDLHPSTNGKNTIDTSTLPFEIPARSLIPIRIKNLIPAAKNIGTTHITNGCYRLHPVEWNIGEAAGAMASLCLHKKIPVQGISECVGELQSILVGQGVELRWPKLRAL